MRTIILLIVLAISIPATFASWNAIGGDAQQSGVVFSAADAWPSVQPSPSFSQMIEWSGCRSMPTVAPFGDSVWWANCEKNALVLRLTNASEMHTGTVAAGLELQVDISATYQPPAFSLHKAPVAGLSVSKQHNMAVLPLGFAVYFVSGLGQQTAFKDPGAGPVKRMFATSAAVDDVFGRVFAIDEDSVLFAFDLANLPYPTHFSGFRRLEPIWSVVVTPDSTERAHGRSTAPVVSSDGSFVCVSWTPKHINMTGFNNVTGYLRCFETADGSELLSFHFPGANETAHTDYNNPTLADAPSISADSSMVYVGASRGIVAFNLTERSNDSLITPLYATNSSMIEHTLGTPLVLWEEAGVAYVLGKSCQLYTFLLSNGSMLKYPTTYQHDLISHYCPQHILPHGSDRRHSALFLDAKNSRLFVSTGDWLLSIALDNNTGMPDLTKLQWNIHLSSCRESYPLVMSLHPTTATPTAGTVFYSACEAQAMDYQDREWRQHFFEAFALPGTSATQAPALPQRYPITLAVKIAIGAGFPILIIVLTVLGVVMWRRSLRKRSGYATIQSN